jgi:hypothetical protein
MMNTELVAFYQRVQEKTIGRVSPDRDRAPLLDRMTSQAQTTAGSIRLYKQASQASDENDVIFPTPKAQYRGVDAAAENLAILTKR